MNKHMIPVHLETQDRLVYGLTAKQVMVLALGLTLAYSAWSAFSSCGLVISLLAGLVPGVLSLLVAFIKPAGTELDEWFLIWLFFLVSPRVYLWEALPPETSAEDILTLDHPDPDSGSEVEEEDE